MNNKRYGRHTAAFVACSLVYSLSHFGGVEIARAAEICQPAQIKIKGTNDKSDAIKAYTCRIGADQVEVMFVDISGFALFDLIHYGRDSIQFVKLGPFDIQKNSVYNYFVSHILPHTPETDASRGSGLKASFGSSARPGDPESWFDPVPGQTYRSLLSDDISGEFPLINTITLLNQGKLPKRLSPFLKKVPGSANPIDVLYWREIEIDDLKNYARDAQRYLKIVEAEHASTHAEAAIPPSLRALSNIFPTGWPQNFILLDGYRRIPEPGCDDGQYGVNYWVFSYYLPRLTVRFAILKPQKPLSASLEIQLSESMPQQENALRESADVDATLQNTPTTTSARVSDKTVVVPLNIAFDQSPSWPFKMKEINQNREDVTRVIRAIGFTDEINFKPIPLPKKYLLGPAMRVATLNSGEQRFDFRKPPANKISVDIAWELGSCPYLLAQAPNGEWIEHGKVLHKANGLAQRATDARVFQGPVTRFKLEEREAERARIDGVHLRVALKSGGGFTLKPDVPFETTSSDQPLELLWGQGAELNFTLPASIARMDVKETELVVSGYYERYNALFASGEARH